MEKIQFTLYSTTGKYKPMSTVLQVESIAWANTHKEELKVRGVTKICAERKTDIWALQRNGYTKIKMRVYQREQA